MNLDDDFDWDEHELYLRPWSESRMRIVLSGLVHALSFAFLWGPIADVWQIARSASFTADIPDEWQF